jgi:hypothetical protein
MQGFGVTARSTAEARKMDPTGIVTFRQSDVGEYLREVCISNSAKMSRLTLCVRRIPSSLPDCVVKRTAFRLRILKIPSDEVNETTLSLLHYKDIGQDKERLLSRQRPVWIQMHCLSPLQRRVLTYFIQLIVHRSIDTTITVYRLQKTE